MNTLIENKLLLLEDSKDSHFNITKFLPEPLTIIDLYAFMVLKRSISLVFGFTGLIRKNNYLCTSSLVRLQIDNLLRFRAAFIVDNQISFIIKIFKGEEVRKLKDCSGKVMTDSYLQGVFSPEYPWLKNTYKQTSGYIHLSEKHLQNTLFSFLNEQGDKFDVFLRPTDEYLGESFFLQATGDMILVTHSLLDFLSNWATSKNETISQ